MARATVQDVAKTAGVSVGTVSRVLNGSPAVSESSKAKVAAAIRHPAQVLGDGKHSVRQLIEAQSRRRQAATGGESRIPLDEETARTAELISEINNSAALIVVEHDMQFIRMISRTVTLFHEGRILMEDTMDAISSDKRAREVYLGHRA